MPSQRTAMACWWFIGMCWAVLAAQAHSDEATAEAGHPFTQNFTAQDYAARSQNWAATQDREGLLYFGNQGVVLQYDGVAWQKIVIGQVTDVVRGLAADPATGTVFVGALNEVGFLRTDAGRSVHYQSLVPQLPADARGFRAVHRVFATTQGVFFTADAQLMRWRDGQFRVWKLPAAKLLRTFWLQEHLYVQEPAVGLLRLDGDELVPASADPLFKRAVVMALVPDADGAFTVGTLRDGLFTLRGGQTTPWTGEVNDFCKTREIRRGLRLSDGSLALATASNGVLVLDAAGRFRDRWDQTAGVQNDSTIDLFEDREGGVWLCLASGLTRVEARSSLTVFDRDSGLKSSLIHSLCRVNGTFYVASGAGTYRLVPADPARAQAARAEPVPGLEGDCWSVCEFDGRLLVADTFGVLERESTGRVTRVFNAGFSGGCLARSRVDPARVFLGRRNELRSLRFDAGSQRWVDEGPVPGVDGETHTVAQTPDGDLWLGTNDRGVLRVRFAPSPDGPSRGTATVAPAAPPGEPLGDQTWTRTADTPDGHVLATAKNGLFELDSAHARFAPATAYGQDFVAGAYRFDDIAPDPAGNLWFNARPANGIWLEQELGRVQPGTDRPAAAWQKLSHRIVNQLNVVDCIHAEAGAFWMAGPGGLVRLDVDRWRRAAREADFATLIRRAAALREAALPGAVPLIPGAALPYTRNTVRFRLAANTFGSGLDLRYRTRLEGFGTGAWSDYDRRTDLEYTNLPEGRYLLEVQARDADDRVGIPARLAFQVRPPWYRTLWAYVGYGLAAAAAVLGILRWRLRTLRATNNRLETLVAVRTADLRLHEHELVRARDDAEAANRAKSQFLANMSHELRTPLNAILGYTQILLKDTELSPRNRERLAVVGDSGSHLLTMINEVLDLSKIEAGKLTLEPVDFRLEQVLDEVGAAFRPRLLEKGLAFRPERGPGLPTTIHADAGKLRQVLFNLLSNAVKFTRQGEVRLEVRRTDDGRTRFAVADTGVGIAETELREVFLAFHQAGDPGLAAQGTGLGLTISRRLVELLGGTLEVESRSGLGSRFWFDLALEEKTLPLPLLPVLPLNSSRVTGYHGARRRLLVVDDEPVNRQILRGLLEPLGFAIEEAADGEECLERCAQTAPDALLLDLRMDRVDGFEVARRLQALGRDRRPRLVAVSASVFDDQRQLALDAGCDAFLPKPFREEELLSVLGRVLTLEWIATPPPDPQEPAGEDQPPSAEIDAMLELSRRGDILGLRKRLLTLQAADGHGGCHSLVRGLEPLVAGYQMDRIRDVLLHFKENGTR